jgi:hypothetical protein
MAASADTLSAAVELLTLPKGLYVFSVRSTIPSQRLEGHKSVPLPALHVGVGPGAPTGQVEFMLGPETRDGWLAEPQDQLVVKVTEPSAALFLTSVVSPGMIPLEIAIQRLDRPDTDITAAPNQTVIKRSTRKTPPPLTTRESVRLKVTPHIRIRGDMGFGESQWAGLVGEQLWVESFTVLPLDTLAPELIEYKGITATGVETPWVSGGGSCGTRGIAVPLVGFAVRIKSEAIRSQFTCEYGAILMSGSVIGPVLDGESCRSEDTSDAIEALWITISKVDGAAITIDSGKAALQAPTEAAEPFEAKDKPEPVAKKRVSPVGPRFSVFREAESEKE